LGAGAAEPASAPLAAGPSPKTPAIAAVPARKKLLIVGPQAFHPQLQDYIAHKQKQGPAELVSLEAVLAGAMGRDDPERLKRFFFDHWKNHAAGYVLLVGDADVFPVRYMVLDRATPAAFDYAFYPSDLYYSDLANERGEFDDWNAEREGFHADYIGEVRGEKNKFDAINYDNVDYRPEIAVGRWPVSNAEEVTRIVAKTIAYEQGLRDEGRAGAKSAVLMSVGGWVDSRGAMDRLSERLPSDWKLNKRYYADPFRNDKTPPPTQKQLVELLNSGQRLVYHAGHGFDHGWDRCFSIRAIKQVHNSDRLPIIISAGCSSGRLATLPPYEPYVDTAGVEHKGTTAGEVFDAPPPPPACCQKGRFNPTGLGEQLLRQGPNGAVAYIGCNTGSQPCGMTLLDGFSETLSRDPDALLGDCWTGAICYYYDKENLATIAPTKSWYPASIFFQGMKFMLYGDPTLPMGRPASER